VLGPSVLIRFPAIHVNWRTRAMMRERAVRWEVRLIISDARNTGSAAVHIPLPPLLGIASIVNSLRNHSVFLPGVPGMVSSKALEIHAKKIRSVC